MDIHKLITNYKDYFWSKSEDGFVCGGYDNNACFWGQISIVINDEIAVVNVSISDSVSKAILIPSELYFKGDNKYSLIDVFTKELDDYLNNLETHKYQELNRETLNRKVAKFLPEYREAF